MSDGHFTMTFIMLFGLSVMFVVKARSRRVGALPAAQRLPLFENSKSIHSVYSDTGACSLAIRKMQETALCVSLSRERRYGR